MLDKFHRESKRIAYDFSEYNIILFKMEIIGPASEIGDAATIVVAERKKLSNLMDSELNERRDDLSKTNGASSLSSIFSKTSLSMTNKAIVNRMDLLESGILSKSNNASEFGMENCGFPYYRSCTSDRGPYDALLVKDVGVSCTISDKDSKNAILENYLLDRLKTEYNDLSAIAKKISAYTKDILQSLSSRSKGIARSICKNIDPPEAGMSCEISTFLPKISSEFTSRPVAVQCSDENGNPCLKLRFKEPLTPVLRPRSISRNNTSVNRFPSPLATKRKNLPKIPAGHFKRNEAKDRVLVLRDEESTCRQVESVKRISPEEWKRAEVDSSGCSGSSIYKFLMSGKRKSWQKKEISKNPGGCYEGNSESFDPSTFSNKIEDGETLREQYRILVPSRSKEKFSIDRQFSKDSCSETFHAVNIRIIKRAPKDT